MSPKLDIITARTEFSEFSNAVSSKQNWKISLTMSRHLDIIRDFLDIIVAESSFTPYYVQEISLTMSSLLDTMGIALHATLVSGPSVLSSSSSLAILIAAI